jgi:hypothetical protein
MSFRLSGAKYSAGPDLQSRFHEANAPVGPLGEERNEMNPITYCAVIREAGKPSVIAKPSLYDERAYLGTNKLTMPFFRALHWPGKVWSSDSPLFVDTEYPEGMYSGNSSIYTHRRLVDRYHNGLPSGNEKVVLNWPVQDYEGRLCCQSDQTVSEYREQLRSLHTAQGQSPAKQTRRPSRHFVCSDCGEGHLARRAEIQQFPSDAFSIRSPRYRNFV